jgi:hypothetical protein
MRVVDNALPGGPALDRDTGAFILDIQANATTRG